MRNRQHRVFSVAPIGFSRVWRMIGLVTVSIGGTIAIVSCADTTSPKAVSQGRIRTANHYAWAGTEHNDGLGFVFAELQKNNGKFHSAKAICNAAIEATRKYDNQVLHSHGVVVAAALKNGLRDCIEGRLPPSAGSPQFVTLASLQVPTLRVSILT